MEGKFFQAKVMKWHQEQNCLPWVDIRVFFHDVKALDKLIASRTAVRKAKDEAIKELIRDFMCMRDD